MDYTRDISSRVVPFTIKIFEVTMWMIVLENTDTDKKYRHFDSVQEMIEAVINYERDKREFNVYHCNLITSTVTNNG